MKMSELAEYKENKEVFLTSIIEPLRWWNEIWLESIFVFVTLT